MVSPARFFIVMVAWALVGAAGLRIPFFIEHPVLLAALWMIGLWALLLRLFYLLG